MRISTILFDVLTRQLNYDLEIRSADEPQFVKFGSTRLFKNNGRMLIRSSQLVFLSYIMAVA